MILAKATAVKTDTYFNTPLDTEHVLLGLTDYMVFKVADQR